MRIVTTLRGRLIAMVAALVAVTLGTAAIISTRVAHYEIRKFDVEVHAGPEVGLAVGRLDDLPRVELHPFDGQPTPSTDLNAGLPRCEQQRRYID